METSARTRPWERSDGTVHLKDPRSCTAEELGEFARLIRRGFGGSDDTLEERILVARLLCFYRLEDRTVAGIAGLKAPGDRYRDEVFFRAAGPVSAAKYEYELGWVYVLPEHRGGRIAGRLCRGLLESVPAQGVFTTTRPGKFPMHRILLRLGFHRVDRVFPHPRRAEELALYLR